ncbi:MAG: hypothetical protein V2A79_17635 [Planctomycetota bacterium]
MRTSFCLSDALRLGLVLSLVVLSSGCQGQSTSLLGGGGSKPKPSAKIVVWQDPAIPDSEGTNIRDANNDAARFVVIGTDGQVDFVNSNSFLIARDITADVQDASIQVGSGIIDIRFGVAPSNATDSRAFLVDRASGHFIQLVGGTSDVTFQVTETQFEDPNDPTDDQAVAAGEADNPLVTAASSNTPTTNVLNNLCGVGGAGMIPVVLLGLLGLRFARRRRL